MRFVDSVVKPNRELDFPDFVPEPNLPIELMQAMVNMFDGVIVPVLLGVRSKQGGI
jgi:hypothetical protein